MTRDETKLLIRTMMAYYPSYKPADISETVTAWAAMLTDVSAEHAMIALKTYVATDGSGFAPAVGKIISLIHDMTEPKYLNPLEAWALVSKAIQRSGYYAEEEFEKLPPVVQKAVGRPATLREWARIDTNTVNTVSQAQFLKTYKAEVKREQDYNRLPLEAKKERDKLLGMVKEKLLSQKGDE